jgi:hypothetical protein
MAVFRPVIEPAAHLAPLEVSQFTHRSRIGPHPVSDDLIGFAVSLRAIFRKANAAALSRFFVT